MPFRHLALPVLLACTLAGPVLAQQTPDFFRGTAAEASQATRTVTITPQTRWVNVEWREAVLFDVGGTRFAWRFDGPGARAVDLQQIAPAGLITRPIMVYVSTQNEYSRRQ